LKTIYFIKRIYTWFKKFYSFLRESVKDVRKKTISEKYEDKLKKAQASKGKK